MTAAMIPLVALLVPETPAFYTATRPADAVARINRSLTAFGKATIAALPPLVADAPDRSWWKLVQPAAAARSRCCWPSVTCSTPSRSITS
ncbi:hypothetical protein [Novosphingobium sp.]|uniref:hypothetical protein n=1 Tax=Novosphingobium sp. TaxID=1874826 RepID=UPI0025E91930|nr:hypothetical protein [Novosphingobium sp.]